MGRYVDAGIGTDTDDFERNSMVQVQRMEP